MVLASLVHYFKKFGKIALAIGITVAFFSCKGQSPKSTVKPVVTNPKIAPESLDFTVHITESHSDGAKLK